jgi:hypothetical protein
MATFLCFFSVIYSLWPLPMNVKAAFWHYWCTVIAIAAFWACFYFFALHVPRDSNVTLPQTTTLFGQFVSMIIILLAQAIFVVSLILAAAQLRHSST